MVYGFRSWRIKIVDRVRGEDYHVITLDNVIRDANQYNFHNMFGSEYNDFGFKNDHENFKLKQFQFAEGQTAIRDKLLIEIEEDIGKVLGDPFWTPSDTRPSLGLHEIVHPDDSGNYYSAIPVHSDVGHYAAITIFLNRDWDISWGGMNVCLSEVEQRVVKTTPVKFNTGVLVFCPTPHCTVPVFRRDQKRRTFQIFWTYNK